MIPEPAHVADIDQHFFSADDEPAMMHYLSFEMWPPNSLSNTLPGRTPVYMSPSPEAAREAAVTELALTRPGWTVGAGIHNRARCVPPHVGRN
jgi:hypothetical protein